MKTLSLSLIVAAIGSIAIEARTDPLEPTVSPSNVYRINANVVNGLLPFVVKPTRSSTLYVDATWGIVIDAVLVDGMRLDASNYDVDLDELNLDVFRVEEGSVVYFLPLSGLVFGSYTNGDFELSRYLVPGDFTELKIRYRLVSPEDAQDKEVYQLVVK